MRPIRGADSGNNLRGDLRCHSCMIAAGIDATQGSESYSGAVYVAVTSSETEGSPCWSLLAAVCVVPGVWVDETVVGVVVPVGWRGFAWVAVGSRVGRTPVWAQAESSSVAARKALKRRQ